MLWALVPALLKLKRGVPEVISTIMLNFVAVYLIEYLVRGPLKDPQSSTDWSRLLPDSTHLPRLRALWNVRTLGGGAIHGPGGSALVALGVDAGRLHLGVLLAAMVVPLAWLLLTRSTMGFQTRALGLGADAARATGIPTVRATLLAFLTSGGLAGLGGAIELLGVVQRMYLYAPGSPGYGFGGIAVALLGQLHPLGISLAAFFFGALSAGCSQMQRTAGVSMHVAALVQAAMVLLLISLPSASSLTRTWVRLSRLRAPR
jgi:simple sugar transport system permease protein